MDWKQFEVEELLHIEKFYSFFESYFDVSYRFNGEAHAFWECIYVKEGEICASADERVYNLQAGEIIIHKPLEFHKFHVNTPEGTTIIVFSFSLEGLLSDGLRNKIIRLSEEERHILELLLCYIRQHNNLPAAGRKDFLNCESQVPEYMQTVRSYVYLLLLSFASSNATVKTLKSANAIVYKNAVQYMTDNREGNVSISEIAAFCNVGTTFLKQTFQKYAGMSVHKFYLRLKLRYALELLKNGHNVTEVSIKLGFCSQPYFSAAFKRELGYPPSDVSKSEKTISKGSCRQT